MGWEWRERGGGEGVGVEGERWGWEWRERGGDGSGGREGGLMGWERREKGGVEGVGVEGERVGVVLVVCTVFGVLLSSW